MSSFEIVVDSNCDLPPEFIGENEIKFIPMPFELNGIPHKTGDWQMISAKDFYDTLRDGGVATTSQINPHSFVEIFTEYAKEGKDAIFLILSSGLSATYECAVLALKEVKETYTDCNIYPIDSLNATTGHGLLTILTARKRDEGLSVSETAAWVEENKHKLIGLFTVDNLMYLHRGGRLSKLSAITGSVLNIKPGLNFAPDGTLCLKERARGRKAALELMVKQLERALPPDKILDTITVSHTNSREDAEIFAEMINKRVKVRETIVMMMGPVIGAHLGPGAVTVVFKAEMTRSEYEARFYP